MRTNTDRITEIFVIISIIGIIVLKSTGILNIPWKWLFAPIIACFLFGCILMIVIISLIIIKGLINLFKENKNERN